MKPLLPSWNLLSHVDVSARYDMVYSRLKCLVKYAWIAAHSIIPNRFLVYTYTRKRPRIMKLTVYGGKLFSEDNPFITSS